MPLTDSRSDVCVGGGEHTPPPHTTSHSRVVMTLTDSCCDVGENVKAVGLALRVAWSQTTLLPSGLKPTEPFLTPPVATAAAPPPGVACWSAGAGCVTLRPAGRQAGSVRGEQGHHATVATPQCSPLAACQNARPPPIGTRLTFKTQTSSSCCCRQQSFFTACLQLHYMCARTPVPPLTCDLWQHKTVYVSVCELAKNLGRRK